MRRCSSLSVLFACVLAGCGSSSLTTTSSSLPSATLSNSSFSFGSSFVGSAVSKGVVTVTNSATVPLALNPGLAGDPSYSIVAAQSCGAALPAGASCEITVTYAPTTASGTTPQMATLSLGLRNAPATTPQTVTLTGNSFALTQGTVSPTANPQVAQYTLDLPSAGTATVSFGPTSAYGRQTWTKSTAAAGRVTILVAGMLPNTTYHMQARAQLVNTSYAKDTDHTFTTGAPEFQPSLAATTIAGMTTQSGVEQMSISNGVYFSLAVSDLAGNILWSYALPGDTGTYNIEGAKLMVNGDFLVTIGEGSGYSLTNPVPAPGAITAIREIDLAGNTVQELTVATLTQKLQAAGYPIILQQFHHDITPLANGHWLVLSNTMKTFTNLTGYPGQTTVLGDVIIDLDPNLNPVWVWNEFDHLDINRHPWNFPDWTHTNAVLYSPTDGDLIVSMRHQNWVVKVDYANGAGSGNILWHLGEGGDFTLLNGTDPTDWNYAQHFPSFFSANTAGVFSLGLMDNGDDREFPTGVVCNTSGQPPCVYTTIPVFQLDETKKTATLTFHQILPTSLYSFFGGNTELLANGDIEYDLAGTNTTTADIFEVTPTSTPQTVWHMHSAYNAYRGYRIPSLYPGIQW